jgi:hypothetical protein
MPVDGIRSRVTPNLAYGICLVFLGWTLILDRMHIVEAGQILRYWPVGLILVGVTLVIQSFQRAEDTPARPQQSLDAGHLLFWVAVALVASQAFQRDGFTTRADSSESVSVFAVMSHHQQVTHAPVFTGAEMTSVMGRADLDLRQTTVAPDKEAVIEVFTLMGGSTIRVPEGWTVVVRAVPIMGGVKDRRQGARDLPGSPRIVLRGFILMGGLDIRS